MSSEWVFFGEIWPPGVRIDNSVVQELQCRLPLASGAGDTDIDVDLVIADSDVIARMRTVEQDLDLYTLRNVATDLRQAICDVVAFSEVIPIRVRIRSAIAPTGLTILASRLTDARPSAEEMATAKPILYEVALGRATTPEASALLRSALADYRQALREVGDSVELAWRAIEALSYYFGRNNKVGMDALCEALEVNRETLRQGLEIPAAERRHGKPGWMTAEGRFRALKTTREVIMRFASEVHSSPGSE